MIVEHAPAKLNLALHVRARRADGFHDIETLFAFVAAGDELHVAPAPSARFTISGPFATALEGDDDNLVTRAVAAFARDVAPLPPLAIELVKRLPVASGIGGGSADAAAALRACAKLNGVADERALQAVAARLGSDVPACLLGRTAVGSGRGEALRPIAGITGTPLLLVNPGVAVPTGAVFARWDGVDRGTLPDGDALTIAHAGRNDLAEPAMAVAPAIAAVLDALRRPGATVVRMSGSGATCFALFETADARDAAGGAIRAVQPDWWVCDTVMA